MTAFDATIGREILAGTRVLYAGGIITYDDPGGTGRYTKWCAYYAPRTQDFVHCGTGDDQLGTGIELK